MMGAMLNVKERYPRCLHERMDIIIRALMIATLAVFGVALLAAIAWSSEPSGVQQALERLPTYYEDRATPELKAVQLQDMATAIEIATDPPPPGVKLKDFQALVIAIAWHESTLSLRIHRGECKPHECDGGRARGPWQQHRHGMTDADWDAMHGLENVQHQAVVAAQQLRRSYLTCKGSGATWLQGAINNYAGRNCTATGWAGLEERQATWAKVRKRL
jgi:hypothetical protein